MSNNPTTKKQKNILPSFRKELFKHNLKSARDHYGNYMDKILEVTEVKFFTIMMNSIKRNNSIIKSNFLRGVYNDLGS